MPPRLYDFVQEFGRVDRSISALPGENEYIVHISFSSVVSLCARIMKTSSAAERAIQLGAMHEVLRFLLTPTECYHSHVERYFEGDAAGEKEDSSKVGTDKFSDGDVYLRLGNGVNERGRRMPSYLINSNWEGLNMYGD